MLTFSATFGAVMAWPVSHNNYSSPCLMR
jgi:hypothetical protein